MILHCGGSVSRQYRNPMLVIKDTPVQLVEASGMKHEGWLQEFVFKHYQMLPIEETEPTFGPIIPVCRELNVNGNSLDLVFINEKGLLTLVECKLWQNPEARRTVIAQILDYAKDVSTWDYTALEDAVKKASGFKAGSLYELVKANTIDLDEKEFIDNVTRNLRRGRFLLLIIGNGIREGVERITEYLQAHAHLNFGFALVEYGIFRNPDVDDDSLCSTSYYRTNGGNREGCGTHRGREDNCGAGDEDHRFASGDDHRAGIF